MGAIAILNQGNRVTLVVDGGVALADLPAARAAFAVLGGAGFAPLLLQRFAKAASVGEIRAMAPMVLRAAQHALQVADPAAGPARLTCKVGVIGWDDGAAAFTIATAGFTPADVPFLNATPVPPGDLVTLVAGGRAIEDADDWQALGTIDAARRLVAAQRLAHGVAAGRAELLTIDAAGATRHVVPSGAAGSASLS